MKVTSFTSTYRSADHLTRAIAVEDASCERLPDTVPSVCACAKEFKDQNCLHYLRHIRGKRHKDRLREIESKEK